MMRRRTLRAPRCSRPMWMPPAALLAVLALWPMIAGAREPGSGSRQRRLRSEASSRASTAQMTNRGGRFDGIRTHIAALTERASRWARERKPFAGLRKRVASARDAWNKRLIELHTRLNARELQPTTAANSGSSLWKKLGIGIRLAGLGAAAVGAYGIFTGSIDPQISGPSLFMGLLSFVGAEGFFRQDRRRNGDRRE